MALTISRCVWGTLTLLLGAPCLAAPTNPASIKDYVHTSWTQRNGAPADIRVIGQTLDGWLWLGTSTGLYRFDGISFEKWPLFRQARSTSEAVSTLVATRSGDLWVSLMTGSAVELQQNDQAHPYEAPGLPADIPLDALQEDAGHSMWALAANELYRFDGKQWRSVAKPDVGLPNITIEDLIADQQGTLWIFAGEDGYRLRKGESKFSKSQAVFPHGPHTGIWKASDGNFWVLNHATISRLDVPDGPYQSTTNAVGRLQEPAPWLIDGSGNMWSVDCKRNNLCRYPNATQAHAPVMREAFELDGLQFNDNILSGLAMTALLDQSGDIWVGTKLGLDRFHAPAATVVRFPQPSIYFAMIPAQGGAMWTGTASLGLGDRWWFITDKAGPRPYGDFQADATAVYRDTDGGILIGGLAGLWRFHDDGFTSIPTPPAMAGRRVQFFARDPSGRLWIAFRETPVYRLDGTIWIPKGNIDKLPDAPALASANSADGSVYFGYAGNQFAVLNAQAVRLYSYSDGLQTGTVAAIWPGSPTLVGGELGLAAFDGRRFHMLQLDEPGVLTGITGLLLAKDGCYWLNTHAGAIRIEARDLLHAIRDPNFKMPFRLFDSLDGLPGGSQQVRPLPSLVEGSDGRLWFAQTAGLAWIDPKQIDLFNPAPDAVIRGFSSGNQIFPLGDTIQLPAGTQEVRILYTALKAPAPECVQFRYRIRELGDEWQLAGKDRVANFNHFEPGDYHFEVEASVDGKSWTPSPASVYFVIAPRFFQTIWFNLLCASLLLACIVIMMRRHTFASNERLRLRLEARHAERERIARELHDTLLQGIQGLILRIHASIGALPEDHPATQSIEHALDRAQEALEEGRNRVSGLRLEDGAHQDFVCRFAEIGAQLRADYSCKFRVISNKENRKVTPLVSEEAYLIAREALLNAFRHAHACEIEVEVSYGFRQLRIYVRDDGLGMDRAPEDSSAGKMHWGITGMRERARHIGAQLIITSAVGCGTEVVLSVPSRIAYVRKS